MDAPKSPPEEAGPRIIANFITEYLSGVKNDYELLQKACDGPPKISLPDLQLETLVFGLHCLDRAVLAHWGPEYRAVFMDHAFAFACDSFAAVLPEHAREHFLKYFDELCQTRQREYGEMKLFPGNDGAFKGVLAWEFGKRICFDADAYESIVLMEMVNGARSIFMMMNKIAQTL
jgi:hypothetical protein